MKKTLYVLPVFMFAVSAVYAAAPAALESVRASDIKQVRSAAGAEIPMPAAPVVSEQVPQDLLAKFNNAAHQLSALRNELTWVSNDLYNLEVKARQMIQLNSSDAFFQMDLRRMSSDMSRRVNDLRRISVDVRNLLDLAQKSPELNTIARNMELSARDILNQSWPRMEDAAQRLEWTIRSGKPEIIGYDAQWTAMDISRFTRDFSYQARNVYSDAQSLTTKTQ